MNPDAMYSFWKTWFAQPESEKLRFLRTPGKGGFYPMASEQPGYTGTADPKEYFHWRIGQGHPGSGPALEPETATEQIFHECLDKARDWCEQRGLGKLCDAVRSYDCVLRIIHYPPSPTGNVGQAHCDFDLLTVSVPGTVPGLEVWDPDDPTPVDENSADPWVKRETFETHVGEMLEIYTSVNGARPRGLLSGQWIEATRHRVRTPPNTERLKAVFFFLPPMDFELRPGFTARMYLDEVLSRAGTREIGTSK